GRVVGRSGEGDHARFGRILRRSVELPFAPVHLQPPCVRETACVTGGDPVEGRPCSSEDLGRNRLGRIRPGLSSPLLERGRSFADDLCSVALAGCIGFTCLRDDPQAWARGLPGEQDKRQGDRGGQQEKRGRHYARAGSCHRLSPFALTLKSRGGPLNTAAPPVHRGSYITV